MRNKIFLFIVTMLYIAGAKVYAHDIQVVNDDGVTIYYVWSNNGNELAVSHKGTLLSTEILYNFYSGNVAIPTSVTYNGKTYNVTSIRSCAFMNCSSLTSVTIPNSVTSIGNGAFSGCSGLTSITIPNSVTSIDPNAFEGCSSLTSITIPPGIKIIDFNTFKGCSSLVSFNIPDNVTKIEGFAFEGCSSLTAISIPNSVTTLGPKAFEDCI